MYLKIRMVMDYKCMWNGNFGHMFKLPRQEDLCESGGEAVRISLNTR